MLQRTKHIAQRGFTLLEVLLVVAIIAILAGIVIIAINPGKNLSDTRNSQRQADVNTILSAVSQYGLDNNGTLPATITATPTEICKTGTAGATCTSSTLVDLTAITTSGKYVPSIPLDPQCPTACHANGAGYMISKDAATGRITVSAPDAEGKTITGTR